MNKKELIDKQALIETLEELKKNSKRCIGIDWRGKTVAYFNLIGLVKQLNESQKPVMPKFFDDWAKQVLEKRDKFYAISLITRAGWGYGVDFELNYDRSPSGTKELLNWIVENEGDDYPNKKKAVEALLHGYEVEKKPKYIVKIGKLYLKEPLGDTSNFTILTTWDKKCAYPFSSFHMADIHAAKFEGTVEEEAI